MINDVELLWMLSSMNKEISVVFTEILVSHQIPKDVVVGVILRFFDLGNSFTIAKLRSINKSLALSSFKIESYVKIKKTDKRFSSVWKFNGGKEVPHSFKYYSKIRVEKVRLSILKEMVYLTGLTIPHTIIITFSNFVSKELLPMLKHLTVEKSESIYDSDPQWDYKYLGWIENIHIYEDSYTTNSLFQKYKNLDNIKTIMTN